MQAKSSEARDAFSDRFFEIDEKMLEVPHREARQLRRAWEEYRETIVDQNAKVIQNTVRPEHFFVGLAHGYRAMGWFANIAIAVGLLFTFLGIIAALSTLDLSGGPEAMQSQLNELMQVAGAKFWASVGGILASILLRSVDYRFSNSLDEQLYRLCDLLEHGMAYLPPQRIASDQLRQLEEQTPAMKAFAEQIAVLLDEALERQFTPMVASLGSIQQGIEKISGDGGAAIHKVVSDKLIFPTRRNLERLALFASFAEARAQALAIPVRTIMPRVDTSGGAPVLRIMEDAGYPVTSELLENVSRG